MLCCHVEGDRGHWSAAWGAGAAAGAEGVTGEPAVFLPLGFFFFFRSFCRGGVWLGVLFRNSAAVWARRSSVGANGTDLVASAEADDAAGISPSLLAAGVYLLA